MRGWALFFPFAPGRPGTEFISVHGPTVALPGVRVHQFGDREIRVLFSPDRLADVAELFKARR
jgi:hypothetical protein